MHIVPPVRTAIEEFGRTDARATMELMKSKGTPDAYRRVSGRFRTVGILPKKMRHMMKE